jgi:hypothetical protein
MSTLYGTFSYARFVLQFFWNQVIIGL